MRERPLACAGARSFNGSIDPKHRSVVPAWRVGRSGLRGRKWSCPLWWTFDPLNRFGELVWNWIGET